MGRWPTNQDERFWNRVDQSTKRSCWLWTGSCSWGGYGRIRYRGPSTYAHRVSWLIHFGEIPPRMLVLHKCDNPPCVNPKHLFLGSQADNMRDMKTKQRSSKGPQGWAPSGEDHWSTKLKAKDVRAIRKAYAGGATQNALAKKYSMVQNAIGAIVRRVTWRHVG